MLAPACRFSPYAASYAFPLPPFGLPEGSPLIRPQPSNPLAAGHCGSNRNIKELKLIVTHTKKSLTPILIATFRAFLHGNNGLFGVALSPVMAFTVFAIRMPRRKLEISLTCFYSTTSKFLIDNLEHSLRIAFSRHSPAVSAVKASLAACQSISNRKSYEKLEPHVSSTKQSIGAFLIARKTHFVQGTVPSRTASEEN